MHIQMLGMVQNHQRDPTSFGQSLKPWGSSHVTIPIADSKWWGRWLPKSFCQQKWAFEENGPRFPMTAMKSVLLDPRIAARWCSCVGALGAHSYSGIQVIASIYDYQLSRINNNQVWCSFESMGNSTVPHKRKLPWWIIASDPHKNHVHKPENGIITNCHISNSRLDSTTTLSNKMGWL